MIKKIIRKIIISISSLNDEFEKGCDKSYKIKKLYKTPSFKDGYIKF